MRLFPNTLKVGANRLLRKPGASLLAERIDSRTNGLLSRKKDNLCLNVRSPGGDQNGETFARAVRENCFDHWLCIELLLSAEVSARRVVTMTKTFLDVKGKSGHSSPLLHFHTLYNTTLTGSYSCSGMYKLLPRNLKRNRWIPSANTIPFQSSKVPGVRRKKKKSWLCRIACIALASSQSALVSAGSLA